MTILEKIQLDNSIKIVSCALNNWNRASNPLYWTSSNQNSLQNIDSCKDACENVRFFIWVFFFFWVGG